MKKGDKIYCIKDLEETHYKSIGTKIGILGNGFAYKGKLIDEMNEDEMNEFLTDKLKKDIFETTIRFQKGKSYTIKSILVDIIIEDKDGSKEFTTLEIINEYFVSERQYRKMKLEELSDINFNNFLNKLKK